LASQAAADESGLFIDLVDQCLTMISTYPQLTALQEILNQSGSVWTLGRDAEDLPELQRRVDSTVTESVQSAAPPGTSSATHLAKAWSDVYGRNPSPSEGYREAVRAVEAAAAPVVSPTNPSPTLGSMLADLRNKPEKWDTVLNPPAPVSDIGAVIAMIELLWKSQLDRHGSPSPAAVLHVSQPEAEAALHIAATLVHLFTSGAITLKP